MNSFVAATVNEHHHSSGIKDYNSGLSKILDQHAPFITCHIIDCPSAPWMSAELKEAKRKQRQAERRWRCTVHRDVHAKERSKVHALHIAAKRQHFDTQICDAPPANSFMPSLTSPWATLESPPFPLT